MAPYGEVENKINEFYDKDIWMWQCEQTKEIRFMPSLARDNMQLAFIMNLSNEFGKSLVKNDIFNLSFDKNALEDFISSEFIDKLYMQTEMILLLIGKVQLYLEFHLVL